MDGDLSVPELAELAVRHGALSVTVNNAVLVAVFACGDGAGRFRLALPDPKAARVLVSPDSGLTRVLVPVPDPE